MRPAAPRLRSRYAPLPATASRSALRAALSAVGIDVDVEAPHWLGEPERLRQIVRRRAHLAPPAARLWWQVRVGLPLEQLEADAGH
jgi:hypothetical protein